jgi:hypothetical protein
MTKSREFMTRICTRVTKKTYYDKSTYEYITYWLYLPKGFHKIIEPYIDRELEITIRKANGELHITLKLKP